MFFVCETADARRAARAASCAGLNAERTRLLAERDDLKSPLLSSSVDSGREAKLIELNGKLYTVPKAQFDKGCSAESSGSR